MDMNSPKAIYIYRHRICIVSIFLNSTWYFLCSINRGGGGMGHCAGLDLPLFITLCNATLWHHLAVKGIYFHMSGHKWETVRSISVLHIHSISQDIRPWTISFLCKLVIKETVCNSFDVKSSTSTVSHMKHQSLYICPSLTAEEHTHTPYRTISTPFKYR